MKTLRFRFSPQGLAAFLLVMLPNFFWFSAPPPNDVLGAASHTPGLDLIASVCQVLLAAALVLLQNSSAGPFPRRRALLGGAIGALTGYYLAWALYYLGFAGAPVLAALALLPCLALLLFAIDRKNWPALTFTTLFTACHLLSTAVNFIL